MINTVPVMDSYKLINNIKKQDGTTLISWVLLEVKFNGDGFKLNLRKL